MGIRKFLGIAALFVGVALYIFTLTPCSAHGQEAPACAGHGSVPISMYEGKIYFSAWQPVTARSPIVVPHFFSVKVPNGKPKELINDTHPSFLAVLFFRHPRQQEIVPAPCDGKWIDRRMVFEDHTTGSIWMYTLSKHGNYLTAEWIGNGSSPRWTKGENLVYLTPDQKLRTYPVVLALK